MSFSVTEDYFPQVQKAIPWTPGMILPPGIDILTKFRMRDRNQVKPEKFWGTVHWAQLFPFLHKLQNEIPGFLVVIWDLRAQDTLRKFSAFHDSSKWHLGLPRKKYKENIKKARCLWTTGLKKGPGHQIFRAHGNLQSSTSFWNPELLCLAFMSSFYTFFCYYHQTWFSKGSPAHLSPKLNHLGRYL